MVTLKSDVCLSPDHEFDRVPPVQKSHFHLSLLVSAGRYTF